MRKTALASLATLVLAGPLTADVVTDWNNSMLTAIRVERMNPPRASRALAITHLAIFDAVNGIQRDFRPYHVQTLAPAGASLEAAIAAAGQTALAALFPNQGTNYNAVATAQLAAVADGQAKTDGIAWGTQVAQAMLALRADDGSTANVPYTPGTGPGQWQPTPPANAAALLPGWGLVKPFTMTSGGQFRPPAPPPVTSSAYSFEFNTVKLYGGTTSTARTEDQTQVAQFWNDGAGTETPPGHWHHIAQIAAEARGNTLAQNARLFALLGAATADAAIASWDAKFAYHYWRPITAIRAAATDGNPETEADEAWSSFIPTPPFPEYTSGHSTFSRSSATILAGFFGTDAVPFTAPSDGLPGITRSYNGFSEAADESGISRLYGGIHWPSANIHGQAAGFNLARQAIGNFLVPLTAARFAAVTQAGQTVTLQLVVEPNRPYVIRASSDLQNWTEIATVNSPTANTTFEDGNATGGLRFYEAVAR